MGQELLFTEYGVHAAAAAWLKLRHVTPDVPVPYVVSHTWYARETGRRIKIYSPHYAHLATQVASALHALGVLATLPRTFDEIFLR